MKLKNEFETLALHRIFMEAKYNEAPIDLDVPFSPIVHDLYERLFELIEDKEAWGEWRKLSNHVHRIPVLEKRLRMMNSNHWNKKTIDEKRITIKYLLVPLTGTSVEITNLIEYANKVHEIER